MNNYTWLTNTLNFLLKILLWIIFSILYRCIFILLCNYKGQIPRMNKRRNRSELLPDYGSDCREIAAAPQHNNSKLIAVLAVTIFSYAQRSPRDRRLHFYKIMTVVKILSRLLISPVPTTRALLIRTRYSFFLGYDLFYSVTKFAFINKCNKMNIFLSFFNTFAIINKI